MLRGDLLNLPAYINPSRREVIGHKKFDSKSRYSFFSLQIHLTHDDFVSVFNMEYSEFDGLPKWRKTQLKKEFKLFQLPGEASVPFVPQQKFLQIKPNFSQATKVSANKPNFSQSNQTFIELKMQQEVVLSVLLLFRFHRRSLPPSLCIKKK